MTDPINHPPHYTDGRQHEPDDVIADWALPYRLGTAVAYLARAGRKPGNSRLDDMRKAAWFLAREIEAEAATVQVDQLRTAPAFTPNLDAMAKELAAHDAGTGASAGTPTEGEPSPCSPAPPDPSPRDILREVAEWHRDCLRPETANAVQRYREASDMGLTSASWDTARLYLTLFAPRMGVAPLLRLADDGMVVACPEHDPPSREVAEAIVAWAMEHVPR